MRGRRLLFFAGVWLATAAPASVTELKDKTIVGPAGRLPGWTVTWQGELVCEDLVILPDRQEIQCLDQDGEE